MGDVAVIHSRRTPRRLAAAAAILSIVGLVIVRLGSEYLWFEEVGYLGVFRTALLARVALGLSAAAVFFLFLFLNLREALRPAETEVAILMDEPRLQLPEWSLMRPLIARFLLPACVAAALFVAARAHGAWLDLVRFASPVAFGAGDPVFGLDVAFHVFRYPLLVQIHGFLLATGNLTVTLVAGCYFLSREVHVSPRRMVLLPRAKRHLLVLASIFFVIKAVGYFLERYQLLFSHGGAAFGASYADERAALPFLNVLVGTAVLAAAACVAQLGRPGVRWVMGGLALWGVVGVLGHKAYSAIVQRLRVAPNEIEAERRYIERTIAATTRAYGLDRIQERPFPVRDTLTQEDLRSNDATIKNIRLWEHRPLLDSYAQLQEIRSYYKFVDVDNDRYRIGDDYRQVMLSVRELSHAHLPSRIWINEHLVYTHGHGAVVGPVNRVTQEGLPEFHVKDIPPVSTTEGIRIERPEVYYGEVANEYVLVGMRSKELDYPLGDQNVYTEYAGRGGVSVGSLWRRLFFALRFGELKILLSDDFTPRSRILYHREIVERARKVAPFLTFDRDPYPVVTKDGRIVWMLDTYTTSSHYPYSQPTPELGNYIRNPIKATVDAYDGTVRFYLIEPDEPMARAYAGAFPGLLRPASEMSEDLRVHVRYPQDFFAIQARMYAAYHMRDPQVFYNKEDLWTIPGKKTAQGDAEMEPYFTIMRLPGERHEEFVLLLPFTPVRRDNMIAWLSARSDGEHYGKLVLYSFPKGKLVFGPRQVEARIDQDAFISQQLSLWSQAGSQVIRGGLLAIPIEESLLYVQPLYLAAAQGRLPELKRIIVAFGNRIAMEETLEESLQRIFGGTWPRAQPAPAAGGPQGVGDDNTRAQATKALEHYRRAEEHLKQLDWTRFGEELARVGELLRGLAGSPGR